MSSIVYPYSSEWSRKALAELRESLSTRISAQAFHEYCRYVDANEYALAVELLFYVIPEEQLQLRANERRLLLELARAFSIDPDVRIFANESNDPAIRNRQAVIDTNKEEIRRIVAEGMAFLPISSNSRITHALDSSPHARLMALLSELDLNRIELPEKQRGALDALLRTTHIDSRWWETWHE